jgi:CDP-paratose synthetase
VKTILLTGATGFLGSNLAHKLVASGHRVLVLKRPSSNLDRLAAILPALSLYDIQGTDLSAPFKVHGKVDAVIHTATCYGRNGETTSEIFQANTAFPLRLLETATHFNTDTFFNTDTILYKYLNGYALSKNHFLEWGKLFAGSQKIRFANIRLEHMYGPGDDASKFTTHIIKSCLENVPELKLTPGEQKRDFIYIDDVIAGYEVLLEKTDNQADLFQEYDLGSGNAITIREFVETIHTLTGSTTRLNFGALPYRKNEIMNSEADIERLKSLGWRCQTNLSDGIGKTMRYEKELQQ